MTLKRRITTLLFAGLVIAAVVGVYYLPPWEAQTYQFCSASCMV
jgi:hypothetical protein